MGRPAVKGPVDETARPVRPAVVDQPADEAHPPVGVALLE